MGFMSRGDGAQSLRAPGGNASLPGATALLLYYHFQQSQWPTGCFTRSWRST